MDIMCTKNTQNFKCEEQKTRTELSNWGKRGGNDSATKWFHSTVR